jgi:acyl carrier protein
MRLQCMTLLTQEPATLAVVTQEIIDLVKTEVEEVDLTTDSILQDVGLDSLKFMSVVFKIEARYDIELQEEDADDLSTVGDLADLVVGRIAEQS